MHVSSRDAQLDTNALGDAAFAATRAWLMSAGAVTALFVMPQLAMWKALTGAPEQAATAVAGVHRHEPAFRSASGFAVAAIVTQAKT